MQAGGVTASPAAWRGDQVLALEGPLPTLRYHPRVTSPLVLPRLETPLLAPDLPQPLSPAEYLRLERQAASRSGYLGGLVVAMGGAGLDQSLEIPPAGLCLSLAALYDGVAPEPAQA